MASFQQDAPTVGFTPFASAPVEDTSVADTISLLGEFAGTAYKEKVRADLKENLRTFGNVAQGVQQGLTDEEIIAQLGPGAEEVKRVRDLMVKTRQAQRQGRISPTMVQVQMEQLTREAINRAPGFEPELRELAAQIYRGDPSTIELNALFADLLNPPAPADIDSDLQEAEWIVQSGAAGNLTVEQVYRNIKQRKLYENQKNLLKAQVELGGLNREEGAAEVANIVLGQQNEVLKTSLAALSNVDLLGPGEMQEVTGSLEQMRVIAKQELGQVLRDMYRNIRPEEIEPYEAAIDQQYDMALTVAQNKDALKAMQEAVKMNKVTAEFDLWKHMPALALASENGWAAEYFDLQQALALGLGQAEALMELDGRTRAMADTYARLHQTLGGPRDQTMLRITQLVSGERMPENEYERNVFVRTLDKLIGSDDPKAQATAAESIRRYAEETNSPNFTLSTLGKPEWRKAKVEGEARGIVQEFLGKQKNRMPDALAHIHVEIQQQGDVVPVVLDGKTFTYIKRKTLESKFGSDAPGAFGARVQFIDDSGTVQIKTMRVNLPIQTPGTKKATAYLLASRGGWQEELGYVTHDELIADLLRKARPTSEEQEGI